MKRIYIAGPYTGGDVAVNVRNAMEAGSAIIRAGHAPFVPHLCHFLHLHQPQAYATWMAVDLEWLAVCDYFYRLPGHSPGADTEELLAVKLGLPVYRDLEALLHVLSGQPLVTM